MRTLQVEIFPANDGIGNVDDFVSGKLYFQWKWIISSFVQLNRRKEDRNAELKLKWCNCTVRVHQHTCVRTYKITQNSLLFFTSSTMQSRIFRLEIKCMACSENRDRFMQSNEPWLMITLIYICRINVSHLPFPSVISLFCRSLMEHS